MLTQTQATSAERKLTFSNTDLEIRAEIDQKAVTINIMKSGTCVHRLTISDAVGPLEHGWIVDLFAREDRIELSQLVRDAEDYVSDLNINQG